jgi:hypothetical protein
VISAWNRLTAGALSPVAQEPASLPRVTLAVKARGWPIERWEALFRDVRASALLTGQVPGRDGKAPFKADFWWVLEHLDEVQAGRYADRPDLRPHERSITVEQARAIFTGRP